MELSFNYNTKTYPNKELRLLHYVIKIQINYNFIFIGYRRRIKRWPCQRKHMYVKFKDLGWKVSKL